MPIRHFRTMRLILGSALCISAFANQARALEGITPFLPGVSIGVPVGALPPSGFYFSQSLSYFNWEVKDGQGRPTGIKVGALNIGPQLLWVPDFKLLGASLGAYVVQPLRLTTVNSGGVSLSDFGVVNTIISPLNMSWNLGGGLFVSAGIAGYTGSWNYKPSSINNVGRNYETIEPGIGVSYLADGWNISIHPVVDINGINHANNYRSGSILLMDYGISKKFGSWDFGLGGTLIQQIEDDKINGVVVPAITGVRGLGNKARSLNIGPTIGYDFGTLAVKAYYLKEIYSANMPGGDSFWLRIDIPLSSHANPSTARDAGGARS